MKIFLVFVLGLLLLSAGCIFDPNEVEQDANGNYRFIINVFEFTYHFPTWKMTVVNHSSLESDLVIKIFDYHHTDRAGVKIHFGRRESTYYYERYDPGTQLEINIKRDGLDCDEYVTLK